MARYPPYAVNTGLTTLPAFLRKLRGPSFSFCASMLGKVVTLEAPPKLETLTPTRAATLFGIGAPAAANAPVPGPPRKLAASKQFAMHSEKLEPRSKDSIALGYFGTGGPGDGEGVGPGSSPSGSDRLTGLLAPYNQRFTTPNPRKQDGFLPPANTENAAGRAFRFEPLR